MTTTGTYEDYIAAQSRRAFGPFGPLAAPVAFRITRPGGPAASTPGLVTAELYAAEAEVRLRRLCPPRTAAERRALANAEARLRREQDDLALRRRLAGVSG
jgi:hypothetical protein